MTCTPHGPATRISRNRLLAGQHVTDVRRRRQPQQHVDVAEAEVRIENRHAMAQARERDREIDRDARLADAAFAARDGDADEPVDAVRPVLMPRSPSTGSPSSAAARCAGVARSRSSGTRCPLPRYDDRQPGSRRTAASGAEDSASSTLVRTSRSSRDVGVEREQPRTLLARSCPRGTTRCVRTPRAPRRTDSTSRAAPSRGDRPAVSTSTGPARTIERPIEITGGACRDERRADDVGVEPQLLDGADPESVG